MGAAEERLIIKVNVIRLGISSYLFGIAIFVMCINRLLT